MASVEITSAAIKGGDFCKYSYEEKTENGAQSVDVASESIIHDDMRYAFRQLVPHLSFICEEVDDNPDLDVAMTDMQTLPESTAMFNRLQQYKVTAFKLTGTGDSQGLVITGQKKLKNEKIVNLNTPNLRWEDEYKYINELRMAIEQLKTEVIHYSEGKKAPELQGSLFDEDDEDNDELNEE